MPNDVLAPPVIPGPGAEPPPQPTEPSGQPAVQPEPPITPGQVESSAPSSQAPPPQREPSEFYQKRKKEQARWDQTQQTISQLQERLEQQDALLKQMQNPRGAEPKVPDYLKNMDQFWADPAAVLLKIKEEAVKEAQENLERGLPQRLSQFDSQKEFNRSMQEAMEMLFPKSSGTDEPLEQRIEKDPERTAQIEQIAKRYKLGALGDPKLAAEITLKMLDTLNNSKNIPAARPGTPNAIKKTLVGPQATGQPAGGGKKMPTSQEVKQEMDKHAALVEGNDNLRFDPTWKAKRAELQNLFIQASKEEKGK